MITLQMCVKAPDVVTLTCVMNTGISLSDNDQASIHCFKNYIDNDVFSYLIKKHKQWKISSLESPFIHSLVAKDSDNAVMYIFDAPNAVCESSSPRSISRVVSFLNEVRKNASDILKSRHNRTVVRDIEKEGFWVYNSSTGTPADVQDPYGYDSTINNTAANNRIFIGDIDVREKFEELEERLRVLETFNREY